MATVTPHTTSATVPSTTAPERKERTRLSWPDVAKGISILGVVLLHIDLSVPGSEDTVFPLVDQALYLLRMPLFFVVSGLFSVKVLNMTFGQLFMRRLWFLLVPYVVWTPIELFMYRLELRTNFDSPMPGHRYYLSHMFYALTMYWFLWALVVFTVVLWATKYVPPKLRLLVPLGVMAMSPLLATGSTSWRVFVYMPCFLFAAYLRDYFFELARRAYTLPVIVGSAVAPFVALGIRSIEVPEEFGPLVTTVSSLILVIPALVACVYIAVLPGLGRALQWIGQNTLAVYISHAIAITLAFKIPVLPGLRDGTLPYWMQELAPEAWIIYCFAACGVAAVATMKLMKVPFIGWTLKPPPLDAHKK